MLLSRLETVKGDIKDATDSVKTAEKLETWNSTLAQALDDPIALSSAIRITRSHSKDFILAALKRPAVFEKLARHVKVGRANLCTLLLVSRLEACNICVARLYELWSLLSSKLPDTTCKILVVSKKDLKNQSGTGGT
jgi:hypothetical protein